jgi:hypothetical protein
MWAVTESGKCGEIRWALGVYLLGAISPADRGAVGRHLAGCAECKEELARLAGLPGLLGTVPAADVIRLDVGEADPAGGDDVSPDGPLPSLLERAAGLRRHRLWRRLAVTAGVVVIVAGGAVAGSRVLYPQAQRPAADSLPWVATARGSNLRTGAGAAVRYVPQSWGLGLEVQVSGIPAGTTCELWVINSRGQEVEAGGWMIAEGHAGAWYPASSPFPVSDVRAFAVTTGGKVLVSVPLR